jgi:proteasome lid subunit RPN8/RPN11
MRYFVVRALDSSNQMLAELDVPLSQVWPLLDDVERELRARGVVDARDKLLKRLVPRCQASYARLRAYPLADASLEPGDEEYGLHFAEEPGDPAQPIQALSAWFCSPTGPGYALDLPVGWLFGSAQARLFQRLLDRKQVRRHARLRYQVFLQGHDQLRTSRRSRHALLIVLQPADPPQPEVEALDRELPGRPPVEVTLTERQTLVRPETRSWMDYHARLQGVRYKGDLRILISRQVVGQLQTVANDSLRQDAEVGGFLIGDVFQDPEDEKLFVDISNLVAADRATGSFVELRFNQEAWQQAFEEINRRFPGQRRVGWYHTHLIGKRRLQPVILPEAAGRQAYELVETTFFSQADAFLHRSFFPEPWHVALVVDLKLGGVMFYQWKQGEIASCRGFFIYEQAP